MPMFRSSKKVIMSLVLAGVAWASTASAAKRREELDFGEAPRGKPHVYLPQDYVASRKYPLIVLLHGYSATGFLQDYYFRLSDRVTKGQFLLLVPEGLKNEKGLQYWNAIPECCAPTGSTVDDAGYLLSLVAETARRYGVDESRVFVVGHSNGAYMANRLACEHGDKLAGIVASAGSLRNDAGPCKSGKLSRVMIVYGTRDGGYEGRGTLLGAEETIAAWRKELGCQGEPKRSHLDLLWSVIGQETTLDQWDNCGGGDRRAAMMTWREGPHIPHMNEHYAEAVISFLLGR